MNRCPWMPFYVNDYLQDTIDLTMEERGVYITLLCHAWARGGPLGDDPRFLRALFPAMHGLRFNRLVPPILIRFFYKDGDCWRQKRVEQELRKSAEISEKRSRSAQKRWLPLSNLNGLGYANAMPSQSQRKKEGVGEGRTQNVSTELMERVGRWGQR